LEVLGYYTISNVKTSSAAKIAGLILFLINHAQIEIHFEKKNCVEQDSLWCKQVEKSKIIGTANL
jgi:hypothetical protein